MNSRTSLSDFTDFDKTIIKRIEQKIAKSAVIELICSHAKPT